MYRDMGQFVPYCECWAGPSECKQEPAEKRIREIYMVRNSLVAIGVASSLALLAQIAPAQAQNWPQRPITMIVSQPAGTAPDVMARFIAERLATPLGQNVIIENKPGAANIVGTVAAAHAAPDGYTLFFATSAALVTNPYMVKNLPYNPVKDFVPIALAARSYQVIVVNPKVEAKTLAELIALEKKSPGTFSMSVDGPRNLAGVVGAAINKYAGTHFVLIPAANVNTGAQDVMTGRTQSGIFSVSVIEQHVRAGTMRAIAVAPKDRAANLPDVPAAAETLPGFDFQGWFMVIAPAGVSPDIVKKVNAAINDVLKDPKVKELAQKLGFEFWPNGAGTPQEAAAFIQKELALWEKITKDLGIEPQ